MASRINVIAEFRHNQVRIRNEIWELLKDDTETSRYIWNEARSSAHETLAEFCFAHIASTNTQGLLDTIFKTDGSPPLVQHPQIAC